MKKKTENKSAEAEQEKPAKNQKGIVALTLVHTLVNNKRIRIILCYVCKKVRYERRNYWYRNIKIVV